MFKYSAHTHTHTHKQKKTQYDFKNGQRRHNERAPLKGHNRRVKTSKKGHN